MKNLSAKNNEEKNDFSASLRPFGTHNSHYLTYKVRLPSRRRCTIYPQSKPKKIVNQGGALLF